MNWHFVARSSPGSAAPSILSLRKSLFTVHMRIRRPNKPSFPHLPIFRTEGLLAFCFTADSPIITFKTIPYRIVRHILLLQYMKLGSYAEERYAVHKMQPVYINH